ncbi:MAG TPA: methyltransferase domain-containing protein [Pirellulales bacterium]|nr:methyltransferase domain-containing protein [Pirellulales bacterium]
MPDCPGTTAALLPTLVEYGQLELAHRWCDRLVARQLADGSFPRSGGAGGSLFNTAQAVAALAELIAAGIVIDEEPARRAADYLASRVATNAEISPVRTGGVPQTVQAVTELGCLAALSTAARRFLVPDWQQAVERAAGRLRRLVEWSGWRDATSMLPYAANAWLDLGDPESARDMLVRASAIQRRDGAVPTNTGGSWGNNAALAHLALAWYRLGEHERADRALVFLDTHQSPLGDWLGYWGRQGTIRESAWVVKYYLDAVRLQVTSSFAGNNRALPRAIDRNDGRWRAVEHWMAALGHAPKVADVGCGSGRFLRELATCFPSAHLVGIDPAASLLAYLPQGVEPRRGGLLRIPAADHEFDGVLAVESLEHSLLPQQAVKELCRVVRPGGRICIIDKHAARQPLSLCEPWERWFWPETIADWLAPYCRDISSRPVAHGPDANSDRLFLGWEATRRG